MPVLWSGHARQEIPANLAQCKLEKQRNDSCSPLGRPLQVPAMGKIFDFKSLNSVPKKEFEVKLGKILEKLSSLKIRSQTKLKIFSIYVPSQFNFELKIYNFTDSFLSGVVEKL